jgi:hypothetical protein
LRTHQAVEMPWSGFHQLKAFFNALKTGFYLDIRLFQPENVALQFVNFIPETDLPLLQLVVIAFGIVSPRIFSCFTSIAACVIDLPPVLVKDRCLLFRYFRNPWNIASSISMAERDV